MRSHQPVVAGEIDVREDFLRSRMLIERRLKRLRSVGDGVTSSQIVR
jgi:hypothetical protein